MTDTLVDLVIADDGWDILPDLGAITEQAAGLALESVDLDPAAWTICILATNDTEIALLNGEFRGKNSATNVLSWPAFDLAPAKPGALPARPEAAVSGPRQPLGDVAIALQTVQGEAQIRAIPLKDHVIHLILHGCLHLLGFDHRIDEDAETMEWIEVQALARVGIGDPYLRDAGR